MEISSPSKKIKKTIKITMIFLAVTTVTTFAVAAVILEGRRAKREKKLLEYEVW
ncbi:MAG: hypothetical protein ABIN48_00205 [Ginsengibacter sp.]